MTTRRSPEVLWTAIGLGLMPWPLVGYALYGAHSYRLAFLLYHSFCFLGWMCWGGGSFKKVTLPPFYWKSLVVSVPVTAAIVSLCVSPHRIVEVLASQGFHRSELGGFLLYFLLVQPLAEEAFWRGTIYARLAKALPESRAAMLSSTLFAAWHSLVVVLLTPLWWAAVALVGVFGYAMAWFYRNQHDEVLPVAILHSLAGDLPLMLVMALAVLNR